MTVRIIKVTSAQIAAAKLKIKRAEARGLPVDDATRAIANARRRSSEPAARDNQAAKT